MITRNTKVYYATQVTHALIFTIPIWVVFYQQMFSPVQIAMLAIISFAVQMLMELPSGALADMLGRRTILAISFLIAALSFLLFPFGSEYWHYIVLAALIGMSDSFRSGAEEAIVYDTYIEKESHDFEKVYAKGNMLYQVGLIVAILCGGLLYEQNQALPFVLYGLSLIIGFFITLFYIEPNIDSEKFTISNYKRQIKQGIKEVFKDKLTAYTSLFYIVIGGITWSNALFLGSYYMVGLGFDDAQRGFIQGGARLFNALLFTIVLKKIKLGDKFKIIIFPILMIFAFLPGDLVTGWFGVPLFTVGLLTTTGRWIFLSPITNKMYNSKVRATAISVLSLLIGFIYIFIVGISGPIIQRFGIGSMYTVLGLLSLIIAFPLGIKLLKVREESKAS